MYIQSYGCLQENGFLFDTHYTVTMSKNDEEVHLYVIEAYKCINNILYGNTSIAAIVGENGVGKSTCLNALQSWLVNFNDNPGIVIWEQDKQLYYHTSLKAKVHFESKLKIQEFNDNNLKMLSLNAIYFSDIFENKYTPFCTFEDGEIKNSHINTCLDISTSSILYEYINDKNFTTLKANPLRALCAKDSLLQIKLADMYAEKEFRYPWKGIQGVRVLTFELRDTQHLQNHIRVSENTMPNLGLIKNKINMIKRNTRNDKRRYFVTILQEGLLIDYIDKVIHYLKGEGHYHTIDFLRRLDDIAELLFSDYLQQMSGDSFLNRVFFGYDPHIYDIYMKEVEKLFSGDTTSFPDFENYVRLFHEIIKKEWIIDNAKVQHVGKSHNRFSIIVPDKEQLQELYVAYLDTQTYHDIIHFEWKMSSGENSLCLLFARLYDAIWNTHIQDNIQRSAYLLLIDEIDSFYHPRWQQKIVYWLTSFLNQIFPWYDFQIIITTHSPVILSDIPKSNIIFLANEDNKNNTATIEHSETFAANISTLYYDAFFMYDGSIGEIAKQTVDMLYEILAKDYGNTSYRVPDSDEDIIYNKELLVKRLSSIVDRRYEKEVEINAKNVSILLKKLIDTIGEEIWREQLRELFNHYFTRDSINATGIKSILETWSNLSPEERNTVLKEIAKDDSN